MKFKAAMYAGVVLVAHACQTPIANSSELEQLEMFEGRFQLTDGDHHECITHKFIEVVYDHASKSLAVNRLDDQQRRRGWQWLHFAPLTGEPQMVENFFALSRFTRAIADKTDDGWKIQSLHQNCQFRIFCDGWDGQTILLTERSLQVEVVSDVEDCRFTRMGLPEGIDKLTAKVGKKPPSIPVYIATAFSQDAKARTRKNR